MKLVEGARKGVVCSELESGGRVDHESIHDLQQRSVNTSQAARYLLTLAVSFLNRSDFLTFSLGFTGFDELARQVVYAAVVRRVNVLTELNNPPTFFGCEFIRRQISWNEHASSEFINLLFVQ